MTQNPLSPNDARHARHACVPPIFHRRPPTAPPSLPAGSTPKPSTPKTMNMNCARNFTAQPQTGLALLAGALLAAALPLLAQSNQHMQATYPGGIPGQPIITSVKTSNQLVTVTWFGFPHSSDPFQLQGSTTLQSNSWQTLLNTYYTSATQAMGQATYFRVAAPSPEYAGATACVSCHASTHRDWTNTAHAHALQTLKNIGMHQNSSCLPCHTVGYGLPTGFKDEATTPWLANVQCENCHGPAALHAANPFDPSTLPIKEMAGQLCGGCHTGSHHPTYDEWNTTGHAVVTEDMNPAGRISSCGRCHSGTARDALIKGENPAITVAGDANIGVVCVTCHDPHAKTANPAQLLYPTASTKDYYLTTSDVFTNKYDPSINVCAQCHNHRGAAYTSTSRPPHHSPQYNILIGTVGEMPGGTVTNQAGAHALWITNQCVGCHMQKEEYQGGPPEVAAVTGHKFKVETYEACLKCHPQPEDLTHFVMAGTSNRIHNIKYWMDYWGANKAPEPLRTKYGKLAWEYTNPGSLSTGTGPTTAEQALVPTNIKKARHNLYLVLYDGSLGVHNGPLSAALLEAAEIWLQQELDK